MIIADSPGTVNRTPMLATGNFAQKRTALRAAAGA